MAPRKARNQVGAKRDGKTGGGSRGGRGGGRGKRGAGSRGGSIHVPQKRKRDGVDDGVLVEGEGEVNHDYEGLVRLFDQTTAATEEAFGSITDQHSKMRYTVRYPDNSAHASFLVGEKKEEMVWAINLFARSTSINQVLTTAPRDDVNLRVVNLYDVPVLHFRIYIGFLDIGELPTHAPLMRSRGPPIQKAYPYTPASVLELYKSACRLGDPHFSDRVMDRFIELITTAEQYELDFADITALYNSPARESAGRLLFVDLVAAAPGGLDEAEQKADQLPSAFALQLARRVRELAGLPQGAAAAWAGSPEAWCRYHEHTRVGGSCWRETHAESQVAPAEVASESHDAGEGAEANENVEEEVKDAEEETKDGEEGAKDVEEEVKDAKQEGMEDAKQDGVEDAKREEDTEGQQQKTPHPDEEGPRRDSARYD